jgi:protein-S-isoprenylcysteine O-methyltransferase Ste14
MEQKRKIVPPLWLLLAVIAMTLLHFLWPIARILAPPYSYVGAVFIVAGLYIAGSSAHLFTKAGTPVVPFERSTALVTDGFYRYTRNPMYVGLTSILLGAWLLLGTLSPLFPLVAFVWIITTNFIRGEERFLEELFGDEYRNYKRRVRRWV